jgi:hypothetical protein
VPLDVSGQFNLVITGEECQSREVEQYHPNMKTSVLPIGPEFASDTMFHPIGGQKRCDIVYVAAAQHCKRHDVLFNAMRNCPAPSASCVFSALAKWLTHRAAAQAISRWTSNSSAVPACPLPMSTG